jgi:hypothetical protein
VALSLAVRIRPSAASMPLCAASAASARWAVLRAAENWALSVAASRPLRPMPITVSSMAIGSEPVSSRLRGKLTAGTPDRPGRR